MLYHTAVCVPDLAGAAAFYDRLLSPLGMRRIYDLPTAIGYGTARASFWLQSPDHEPWLSLTRGAHYCFGAATEEEAKAFYAAALAGGARTILPLARHPQFGPEYMGAVVEDPDGHKVEVCLLRG